MAPDVIQCGASRVNDVTVYDKQLHLYLGTETYCRLRRQAPELYVDYVECWKIGSLPTEVEAILLDHQLDPTQVKTQLITSYITSSPGHSSLSRGLAHSSEPPHGFDNPPMATFWFVVWLVLIVGFIVWFIISVELDTILFNSDSEFATATRWFKFKLWTS